MNIMEMAGLVKCEDGQYIGTRQQWDKADILAEDLAEEQARQETLDDPFTSQSEIDDINSNYAYR